MGNSLFRLRFCCFEDSGRGKSITCRRDRRPPHLSTKSRPLQTSACWAHGQILRSVSVCSRSLGPEVFDPTAQVAAPQCENGIRAVDSPVHPGALEVCSDRGHATLPASRILPRWPRLPVSIRSRGFHSRSSRSRVARAGSNCCSRHPTGAGASCRWNGPTSARQIRPCHRIPVSRR